MLVPSPIISTLYRYLWWLDAESDEDMRFLGKKICDALSRSDLLPAHEVLDIYARADALGSILVFPE